MKFGWWHIVEPETIKNITRCLHPRGIRERILQKNLLKYADFASSACTAKGSEYFQLDDEDDDDDDESDNDEDEESKNTKHDPLMPDTKDWSCEVAFEVTKSALEDVEALEDKVFSSSMQIK
ncbi:bromodomain adjacent to zinc finger domain protein 2B-like, partial [Saccoglossus kowalevskii]|uniref:Bromodomain adjacent to zinc finger domain protein 2B-like n=1 Tax=Saccoglossus kowalevskii TaxID=10224 RepID=A0ABM0MDZ9_SACKO